MTSEVAAHGREQTATYAQADAQPVTAGVPRGSRWRRALVDHA